MSGLRVALGEHGHAARDDAARAGDKLLHRAQRLARGNNVVNDKHTLAADKLRVRGVDDELLDAHGGDGLDLHLKHAGHVRLRALARKEVLLRAALPRHFVQQGDRLRFGGDDVVIFRSALEQLRRTVDSQLDVAEHNKCADVEVVSDLAERQITF